MSNDSCLLCGERLVKGPAPTSGGGHQYECPNCGQYALAGTLEAVLRASEHGPRRLAVLSHAVRRMQRERAVPTISNHLAEQVWREDRLPTATEQFDNLVLHLGATLSEPGATIDLDPHRLRAVLGSITANAAGWILQTCLDQALIEGIA